MRRNEKIFAVIVALFLMTSLFACAGTQAGKTKATVQVSPSKVAISKAIFKTPIVFTGTGWRSGEIVVVEMVVPPNVEIPAIKPGENAAVGFGNADEKGNFESKMAGMTKIITIFRGSLDPVTFKPIGKTFKPIPFGTYKIQASGMDSGSMATTSIEFIKPPPAPKK